MTDVETVVSKKWRNVTYSVLRYSCGHISEYSSVPKIDEGAYGRSRSELWIKELEPCDCCEIVGKVLHIDTSEGEYGGASLCLPCITDLFHGQHLK
jgi:hypothetical protein